MPPADLYAIPVLDKYLFYAPLSRYARVISADELGHLRQALATEDGDSDPLSAQILAHLQLNAFTPDPLPQGPLTNPFFLGLITTRGCNMGCRYCDFSTTPKTSSAMPVELARAAIDAYLDLLSQNGKQAGEIQFFGGEPFFRNRIVEFAVGYARHSALKKGIELHFEVTTNGLFGTKRSAWIADNLDAVVLSLDGPAEFQNAHRPLIHGAGSFEKVFQNAKILSEGNTDLIIRVCVTDKSASQLPEIARWIAGEFIASSVCFEPLTACELSIQHGLLPPDPVTFAAMYLQAEDELAQYGILTITSGTDLNRLQHSFCPVGKDAILVTPEGRLNACYLLEQEWEKEGLDLSFGRINPASARFQIDAENLEAIRCLAATRHPLCAGCFCKYHCAGACHVNHRAARDTSAYDAVCVQTRLITTGKLLKRIQQIDLYQEWISALVQAPITAPSIPNCLL